MITLEELWYAWCDIDEHTEVHLAFDGEDEFDTFKFSERDKWRRYDKTIPMTSAQVVVIALVANIISSTISLNPRTGLSFTR